MSTFKIVWTHKAIQQTEDIFDYISQDSFSAAEKVRDDIFNSVVHLIKFPFIGQEELLLKKFRKGHRYVVCGNYKIIYRVVDNIVFINSVFDSRQNPKKLKV